MKSDAGPFFYSLFLAAYMGFTVWNVLRHDGPAWFWVLAGIAGLCNLGAAACHRFPWWVLAMFLRALKGMA